MLIEAQPPIMPTLLSSSETPSSQTFSSNSTTATCIPNFRQARGLQGRIYRCASPDDHLTDFISSSIADASDGEVNSSTALSELEQTLFFNFSSTRTSSAKNRSKTLLIDLRSPKERNEKIAQYWMNNGGNSNSHSSFCDGPVTILKVDKTMTRATKTSNAERQHEGLSILRINVISPSKLFSYLDQHWSSSSDKSRIKSAFASLEAQQQQEQATSNENNKMNRNEQENRNNHEYGSHMRKQKKELKRKAQIQILHSKGLPGLYEAILQTSKDELCIALQEITKHLEKSPQNNKIIIHCVQGKDRTGLLTMLCQSILGLGDDDIIADYTESNNVFPPQGQNNVSSISSSSQARDSRARKKIIMDPTIFAGAPAKAMETTLQWIRSNYDSVSPGYVNAIGFDGEWQVRLKQVILSDKTNYDDGKEHQQHRLQLTPSTPYSNYSNDNLMMKKSKILRSKL